MRLTYNTITQLPADHSSFWIAPEIIAHCAPPVAEADLHTPLVVCSTPCQSDVTVSASCLSSAQIWDVEMDGIRNGTSKLATHTQQQTQTSS